MVKLSRFLRVGAAALALAALPALASAETHASAQPCDMRDCPCAHGKATGDAAPAADRAAEQAFLQQVWTAP